MHMCVCILVHRPYMCTEVREGCEVVCHALIPLRQGLHGVASPMHVQPGFVQGTGVQALVLMLAWYVL